MKASLRLATVLSAGLLAFGLTGCPGFFGEDDPAADVELCDVDPDSCLPDATGGTGLPPDYEPPPDPNEGREQEVEPPPGYEGEPDPGDLYDEPPPPDDPYR